MVQNIHLSGGSLLGVSRGGPGVSEIVDSLEVVDRSILLTKLMIPLRTLCTIFTVFCLMCILFIAGKRDQHALCVGWKWNACRCKCNSQ